MTRVLLVALFMSASVFAQRPTDPFPPLIPATEDVIRVSFVEFASIPEVGGEAARRILLVEESGTSRMFLNDMRGPIFTVNYDGSTVTHYLDINASNWGVNVQPVGWERGFQSFAAGPADQVFLLNRHDGAIRLLVPDASPSR